MGIHSGAFDFPAWIPRRLIPAAAALALNAAIGLALFLCFRIPGSRDASDMESMLIWLPLPEAAPKRLETRRARAPRSPTSSPRARLEALSPIEPSTAPIAVAPARGAVDWWTEGERVVKDRARAAAPAVPEGRIDLHIEPSGDAPVHQAGESYQDEFGDKVVWVSEKCYIESDPPLPGTPPAFAAERMTRTVCPGDSSAPRGDLFKDLPAYRKHHSE